MNREIEVLKEAFDEVLVFVAKAGLRSDIAKRLEVFADFFEKMEKPENLVKFAREVMREDYEADVKRIADDVAEHMKGGNGDQPGLEYLEETIDGCDRVIETLLSQEGIASSSRTDAIEDEGLGDEPNWMAVMYHALRADVLAELGDRGVDINLVPGQTDEDEDEDETVEPSDGGAES